MGRQDIFRRGSSTLLLALVLGVPVVGQEKVGPERPASELQLENAHLKMEVLQLKSALADTQGQLAQRQIRDEYSALEVETRKLLRAQPDDTIDWASKLPAIKAKPAPEEPKKDKP